tara:strand:+ start:200 stop:532 length:333 start_codon:yes stop_codon:yes gene_type:complete
MIYLKVRLAVIFVLLTLIAGCQTTDRAKYNTVAGIMFSVDKAMTAYGEAVALELITDADQQRVKESFERYKLIEQTILSAAMISADARAPKDLADAASDLTFFLTSILMQ